MHRSNRQILLKQFSRYSTEVDEDHAALLESEAGLMVAAKTLQKDNLKFDALVKVAEQIPGVDYPRDWVREENEVHSFTRTHTH